MKLALDKEYFVRSSIVRNKKVTIKVLKVLINDEDEEIRSIAEERINLGKHK